MKALFTRVALTLAVLGLVPMLGLVLTYELVKIDWVSFMEIQPSYRPMEMPLPVPEGSVPIQGAAYVAGAGSPENPLAADEVSLERGKLLYALNCALCHGESGLGDGPVAEKLLVNPADLTAENVANQQDGDLFLVVTNGIPNLMPALRENLTVRDRWDVVNYLRTLQGR